MLSRIDELLKSQKDFSFETTLSTRSFVSTIKKAREKGYYITLIFFWLDSIQLAKDRVKKRVAEGGRNIEEKVIERRYNSGISNLFKLYVSKVDSLLIYDNSNIESELIAEKELNGEFVIHQPTKFNQLKTIANEQ